MPAKAIEQSLKEAAQLTGVTWAVCLSREGSDWIVWQTYKLTKKRQQSLLDYLGQPAVNRWVSGALAAGRSRSRKVSSSDKLTCEYVYAFPSSTGKQLFFVGAEKLSSDAQRIWRIISLSSFTDDNFPLTLTPDRVNLLVQGDRSGSFGYSPGGLDKILNAFVGVADADAGWLAVRAGDGLDVRAQIGCPESESARLALQENELCFRIHQTQTAIVLTSAQRDWAKLPYLRDDDRFSGWIGVPLAVGQRAIGQIALWRKKTFSQTDKQNLSMLAAHVSATVDVWITFDEMAEHLQRLALLNDFARTVSSGANLDELAARVFGLLSRTFSTELISLGLVGVGGDQFRIYRNFGGRVQVVTGAIDQHRGLEQAIADGKVVRIEKSDYFEEYQPINTGTESVLMIPLRYRGQVIGILNLESCEPSAFSEHDENLLMVIASHLAGLVEYGRLREDAEARARNLSLIHAVVQEVVGLTDLHEVARIAASLIAKNFAFELALVLVRGTNEEQMIWGIGGSGAQSVNENLDSVLSAAHSGITGYVLETGESILVNDVLQSEIYEPIPNWEARSEMCVALRSGEHVLGLIDVESTTANAFSSSDLLVLESLAGILSGVVANADQYRRLQSTRNDLERHIKAQKEAERKLIQAAKLAAVGEMAAGVAHELNNPLTTISGFTELVLDELPSESSLRNDLELVLRETGRASGVVRRMLDFARQSESNRARTNLNELVEDVLALMRHMLHASGVQTEVELSLDLPWVMIDPNQIKQVILNLLHNAVQAMATGGKLSLITSRQTKDDRKWVRLSITDSGIGIAPEAVDRVFEPFFTTRSNDGGTGLGLSVSYGIVIDHGGHIDVTSTPGTGTVFNIWLPEEN